MCTCQKCGHFSQNNSSVQWVYGHHDAKSWENFCLSALKSYVFSAERLQRSLRNAPRGKPTALLSTFHLSSRSAPHVSNFSSLCAFLSWKQEGGEAAFTCALHHVSAEKTKPKLTSSPTAPSKFSRLYSFKKLERVRSSLVCRNYNWLHLTFFAQAFPFFNCWVIKTTISQKNSEGIIWMTCFSVRKRSCRVVSGVKMQHKILSNISFLLVVHKQSQHDLVR